ncbi:oligosaccharide flippase family protein [Flagellimonas sp.]|uniref:oligosaccharide flippase family protein n=1 Tax=Flagellimonas sp. TaxID=2058762 RepID=UPI003B50C92E
MTQIAKKSIFKNFGYLSLIQVFNLAFPLIIYPYLIRTVGKANYGTILYAQSIAVYFSLIINYGFNIYGTDSIAKCMNRIESKSKIVSSIFSIQILFYLASLIVLYFISLAIEGISTKILLFASYLGLQEIVVPIWYFQGIQQMRFIAICNLLSKLTALILILFFVVDETDYFMILFAYTAGCFMCGLFSFWKIFVRDKVKIYLPTYIGITETLKGSFPLFISHSLGGITTKSNAFFIGSFMGRIELSYYDLAEKIVNIVSMFFANFSNAIFPVMSTNKKPNFVRKAIKSVLVIAILVVLLVIIFATDIVTLLGSAEMAYASNYLILMSAAIVFRAVGPIISTSVLVVNGYSNILSKSFIWVFVSYFFGIVILFYLDLINTMNIISIYLLSLLIMIAYRIYCCFNKGLGNWLI